MIKQLLFLIYVLLFTSIESYILDNVCIMGPKTGLPVNVRSGIDTIDSNRVSNRKSMAQIKVGNEITNVPLCDDAPHWYKIWFDESIKKMINDENIRPNTKVSEIWKDYMSNRNIPLYVWDKKV